MKVFNWGVMIMTLEEFDLIKHVKSLAYITDLEHHCVKVDFSNTTENERMLIRLLIDDVND